MSSNSESYTANVDGSFHTKSSIGGWGFIIKNEKGDVIHSDCGAVPSEFNNEYEQYAFAQMMLCATKHNINKIHVKTDLKIMARRFSEMSLSDIFQYIQKFDNRISFKEIDFSIEHISRKQNKEADALSKSHIYQLFSKEKKEILQNCYPFGHKDLSFLQLPEMKYSIRSTSHDVVNRVFHALKRKHLFIKIDHPNNKFETYIYKDGEKKTLYFGAMIGKGETLNDFFLNMAVYAQNFGRVVLVVDNEDSYNQMIGYTEGELSPSNLERFVYMIERLQEVYVYCEKEKKKNTPKRSKSLKTEINNLSPKEAIEVLKQNNSKRIRQMMISVYVYEFQNTYGRAPNSDEIREIIASVETHSKT